MLKTIKTYFLRKGTSWLKIGFGRWKCGGDGEKDALLKFLVLQRLIMTVVPD
jgi:hypothetical protein